MTQTRRIMEFEEFREYMKAQRLNEASTGDYAVLAQNKDLNTPTSNYEKLGTGKAIPFKDFYAIYKNEAEKSLSGTDESIAKLVIDIQKFMKNEMETLSEYDVTVGRYLLAGGDGVDPTMKKSVSKLKNSIDTLIKSLDRKGERTAPIGEPQKVQDKEVAKLVKDGEVMAMLVKSESKNTLAIIYGPKLDTDFKQLDYSTIQKTPLTVLYLTKSTGGQKDQPQDNGSDNLASK